MSDWSKYIDLEVIKEYLQECAENDDYHYEQYQVDIVMHEYIRQKQIIERLNNIIDRAIEYLKDNACYNDMGNFNDDLNYDKCGDLLDILQGSDKE